MNEFTDTMQPIINLMYQQMQVEQEAEVMRAVKKIGVEVDKDRLIQALTDAWKFWDEGYEVGRRGKPRWISVEERLPPGMADVLVVAFWHERWQTMIGWCRKAEEEWRVYTSHGEVRPGGVTHWMPLPEAPKEEARATNTHASTKQDNLPGDRLLPRHESGRVN